MKKQRYGRFYLTYREKNQAEEASIQIEENQFLLWILNGESENWKKALDEMAEALRRRCVSREAAVKKFAEVKDIAARVASDRQQTEKLEELSLKMERACRMTELKNLAGDCIEVVNTTGIKGKKNRKLILNAREYMKEHFFEETFSMDLLAEHLAISKSYLSKVYKEETGESVWTYVIRLRIAKAKEMLAGSDATGYTIAKAIGYASEYHFSRAFTKEVGMSPSAYKKLYMKIK